MDDAKLSRGARRLGWTSCITTAGRVTLAGRTTFLHINTSTPLTGTTLDVASVTKCLDSLKEVKIDFAKPTAIE